MGPNKGKSEFIALLGFLAGIGLVLTNGFSSHIFAQEPKSQVFEKIEPIGDVLSEILGNYVYDPDMDKVVEGALEGIMNSLDRNSSFIPAEGFQDMREETEGAFDGIGVRITLDEDGNVVIVQPIPGAPASKAGLRAGDIIAEIDGVSAHGITTLEASNRIKGPRGQTVALAVMRKKAGSEQYERIEVEVKRGIIPLESLVEQRMLEGGVGYIRISDFKKNTSKDLRERLDDFQKQGMTSLILDLRWNPGGLLSASREVSELFLPKGSLVTSTKGRESAEGEYKDNMRLKTERNPEMPETMPLLLLVSNTSASSSEIVTGALQFHKRALVIGEKTYGKGSVQTIIPLRRPEGSALRLTTALYYTPGDVTIDGKGILPDIEVPMDVETQANLRRQLYDSEAACEDCVNKQNHGRVTGNPEAEGLVHDTILEKAVEVLREDAVFQNLLQKYHRDIKETQVAATDEEQEKKKEESGAAGPN